MDCRIDDGAGCNSAGADSNQVVFMGVMGGKDAHEACRSRPTAHMSRCCIVCRFAVCCPYAKLLPGGTGLLVCVEMICVRVGLTVGVYMCVSDCATAIRKPIPLVSNRFAHAWLRSSRCSLAFSSGSSATACGQQTGRAVVAARTAAGACGWRKSRRATRAAAITPPFESLCLLIPTHVDD